MRLYWMTIPQPLEVAVGASRRHFALAAGLSALVTILYLAPTNSMMQVYDRVVPTGGVQTLLWITVTVGLAIATLTVLDGVRARVLMCALPRRKRTALDYRVASLTQSFAKHGAKTEFPAGERLAARRAGSLAGTQPRSRET